VEFDETAEYKFQQVAMEYAISDDMPDFVERTFKERWLSWPWRPWVKTRPSFAYMLRRHLEDCQLTMNAHCGITVYHEGSDG
jgi:hypothetical protein